LLTGLISLSYYCYKDRSTMTREDDLYRALGLERTASQEEIRKAYKTTGAFYLRKKFRLSRVFFCTQRRGAFHLVQEESARQDALTFLFSSATSRVTHPRAFYLFSLSLHHHPLNRSFEKPPG
jgi:hypothetical protein